MGRPFRKSLLHALNCEEYNPSRCSNAPVSPFFSQDSASRTIVPRLLAAGADLRRVHLVKVTLDGDEDGLVLPDDVPTLTEALAEAGYRNGILGKVGHLNPIERFAWFEQVGREVRQVTNTRVPEPSDRTSARGEMIDSFRVGFDGRLLKSTRFSIRQGPLVSFVTRRTGSPPLKANFSSATNR